MTYKERKSLYESIMVNVAKIVKNRINEFIENSGTNHLEHVDDVLLNFVEQRKSDLTNVPTSELLKLFKVDFKSRMHNISIITHHPGLKEDFTVDTFNAQFADIQKRLKILFEISDWQISVMDTFGTGNTDVNINIVYKPEVAMDIVIGNVEENIEVLEDFMRRNGYFLMRKLPEQIRVSEEESVTVVHLFYTPFVLKDVSEEIRSENQHLIHMTASENIRSIETNGLVPHESTGEKNGIVYPARVYMFAESAAQEEWFDDYKYQLSQENEDSGNYSVITINVSKLPKGMKMFYDPLIGTSAVFVEEIIKPDCFVEISEI